MSVPDGIWQYDPTTGTTQFKVAGGTLSDQALTSPTGTTYIATGAGLQNAATGQLVLGLGRTDVTTFKQVGSNTLEVITPISWRTANSATSTPDPASRTPQARIVIGDLPYLNSLGEQTSLHVEAVNIAPVGEQVLVYTRDDGTTDIMSVAVNTNSNAVVQSKLGPRYRLATPNEVAEYAMGRYLARNEPDLLREILRQQGVPDQDLSGDNYDIAQYFDLGSMANLQAYSKTWVYG